LALLDTQRFDHLSDEEVLRRIGEILAIGIGRLEEQQLAQTRTVPRPLVLKGAIGPQQFVVDEQERLIIAHLQGTGAATAQELMTVLGLTRPTIARKLTRLRASGLCVVEGRACRTRYRLRTEFSGN